MDKTTFLVNMKNDENSLLLDTTLNCQNSIKSLEPEIHQMFTQMERLWDQLNMDTKMREKRVDHVFKNFLKLIGDILMEEQKMVKQAFVQIDQAKKDLAALRSLFGLPDFDESKYPHMSLTLLKALTSEIAELRAKQENAIASQKSLYNQLQVLSRRVGMDAPEIAEIDTKVFTHAEIGRISSMIEERKKVQQKRLSKILKCQSEAKKIMEMIETNTSFTSVELHILDIDFTDESQVLTEIIEHKLFSMLERLKNDYDAWLDKIAFRYDELLVKLDEVSTKSFRQPMSTKYPSNFDPKKQSERDLEKLEAELEERQRIFDQAEPVFSKLNEWFACWKEKLDIQRKVCRASFYQNRGGTLENKLKKQRQVDNKLPRLFAELQEVVENYVSTYGLRDILVEGMRPDNYAQSLMHRFKEDREMERTNKQLTRVQATPDRTRNLFATPSKLLSSNKNNVNLRPRPVINFNSNSTKKSRKRSLSCSNISVICPVAQTPQFGPRTSSPKPENLTISSATSTVSSVLKTPTRVLKTPTRVNNQCMPSKIPLLKNTPKSPFRL